MTEVATFRSDGVYSDGRHPDEVRYTQAPRKMCSGGTSRSTGCCWTRCAVDRRRGLRFDAAVIDYVGGLADLDAGVIRAIGRPERRFEEDQLAAVAGGAVCGAIWIRD